MQIVLLGTAAGGGFPQWNCWCPSCRVARTEPARARRRTQSSAAVSTDGARWFLLNASPDVHEQVAGLPIRPPAGVRHQPVAGAVLTDAELDHSLGITLLREGGRLRLYTTCAVARILENDSRIVPVTRAFAAVDWVELPLRGNPVSLGYYGGEASSITIEAFPVPAGPPRFASADEPGHTVGLLICDAATGGSCAFLPGCGGLDDELGARLNNVDLVLFDGTFWTDDELIRLGIADRTARQMDHLPVWGPDGSLARLQTLRARHRVYTHINNTNPMLLEDSPERAEVEGAGLVVGMDGMTFDV